MDASRQRKMEKYDRECRKATQREIEMRMCASASARTPQSIVQSLQGSTERAVAVAAWIDIARARRGSTARAAEPAKAAPPEPASTAAGSAAVGEAMLRIASGVLTDAVSPSTTAVTVLTDAVSPSTTAAVDYFRKLLLDVKLDATDDEAPSESPAVI